MNKDINICDDVLVTTEGFVEGPCQLIDFTVSGHKDSGTYICDLGGPHGLYHLWLHKFAAFRWVATEDARPEVPTGKTFKIVFTPDGIDSPTTFLSWITYRKGLKKGAPQ